MPDGASAWYRARWFQARLLGAACPYCAAEAEEVCITAGGQEYPDFHAMRWKLTRGETMVEQYDPVKTQLSVTCYLAETEPYKGDGREFAWALGLDAYDFGQPANEVRSMMHRDCPGHVVIALTGTEFDCICACHFPGLPEEDLLHLDATDEIQELASKYPEPLLGSDDPDRNPMCPWVPPLAIRTCAARAQRRQTLEAVLKLAGALGSEEAVLLVARQLENETYDEERSGP